MRSEIVDISPPILASEQTYILMNPKKWQANGDVSFQHERAKQGNLLVNKGYAELKNTTFSNGIELRAITCLHAAIDILPSGQQ